MKKTIEKEVEFCDFCGKEVQYSYKCMICGKAPMVGNNVSHAKNRTKRRFKPNLRRVRAMIDGSPRRTRVCTQCIKSGRVIKAV